MSFSDASILALALSITPSAALAHHGWSAYGETPQKISGVIREAQFGNPHATLRLETPERTWLVVLAPPSRMNARGLTEDSLKVGETASVEGYAHRGTQNEIRAGSISIGKRTVPLR
jgi:Family of unknown function (DUF6152)